MKKPILFSILAALTLTAGYVQAQGDQPPGERPPGGPGGPGGQGRRPEPPKLEDMDTDKSGDVSQAEFVAFQVKRAEEGAKRMFEMADADKDGKLTKEEMGKMRGPREGGPRGEGGERRRPGAEGEGGARRPEGEGAAKKPEA